MSSYCLKCKENTENINPSLSKTNSGKRLLLSKCALCGGKNLAFIKVFLNKKVSIVLYLCTLIMHVYNCIDISLL